MNHIELRALCERNIKDQGPDAYVFLVVPKAKRFKGGNGRLWRGGPMARFVGPSSQDDGRWIVEANAADVLAWLGEHKEALDAKGSA